MKIKKTLAGVVSFMVLFIQPVSFAEVSTKPLTLAEFLKNTEKVEVKCDYPSMPNKLASANNGTKLQANTPLMIKSVTDISGKFIKSGEIVHFTLINDVKSANGLVLIKGGAPVEATVTFAKKSGCLGKEGQVTISDFHTKGVDGTYIPLMGTLSAAGDDKLLLSVLLGVFICTPFLLMHGEEAVLPAGSSKTIYTAADVYIKTNAL